ncbi:tRNA (guanosine(37)-N1)-methyltransferase TrmD [Candidatus Curtissbacteria bacterium]|nr:tRNA (guanosine(37)-N1)-methyltransferase TrmD [Candidatus Curtissbacteria bacterium]
MTFILITLFPEAFESIFSSSILARAQKDNQIKIVFVNPRDFARDKYKTVDDKPYGGGAGMVMKVDTIVAALESIKPKPYIVLLSASGKRYTQSTARKLSAKPHLAIICGHYEGVDARVEKYVDEVISIGDFVLTGGEIAAAAIVDSVARLIPGVINPKSLESESFSTFNPQLSTYIEYPQYTRPEDFRGAKVPKVLLSGDHKKVEHWREQNTKKIKNKLNS